jgi:hypothetical protein
VAGATRERPQRIDAYFRFGSGTVHRFAAMNDRAAAIPAV